MASVPVEKVRDCQDQFLDMMRAKHQDVIDKLGSGTIDDDATKVIEDTIADVCGSFKA
jgi:F-type H+-transporting ATPase subunit alpha